MRTKGWKKNQNEKALQRAVDCGHVFFARSKMEFLSVSFNHRRKIIAYERPLRGNFNLLARQLHKFSMPKAREDFYQYDVYEDDFEACMKGIQGPAWMAARQVQKDTRLIQGEKLRGELRVIGPWGYGNSSIERLHIDTGHKRLGRVFVTYCGPVTINILTRDISSFIRREHAGTWNAKAKKSAQPFSLGPGTLARHNCVLHDLDKTSARKNFHYAPKVEKGDLKLMMASQKL